MITRDNADDDNMRRQRGNYYARSNGIIKNFHACSPVVKCNLFKAFCCNLYCSHLWCDFKIEPLRRLIVGYNHSFHSASGMFVYVYIMMYLAKLENYGRKVFLVLDSVSTTVLARL